MSNEPVAAGGGGLAGNEAGVPHLAIELGALLLLSAADVVPGREGVPACLCEFWKGMGT
jgi:hypothetical protein